MIIELKEKFYKLVKNLGYNITDNGDYTESFPWLMLKTQNDQAFYTYDICYHRVILTIDIFSSYSGEKEILNIVSNITENLNKFQNENPEILYAFQSSCRIIDDKATGPVKKHGIVNYDFLIGKSYIKEDGSEIE